MGKRYEHTMEFGGIMSPTSPAPVDNRTVVDAKADLINPDTWNGKAYEGMIVTIPSLGESYMLTDLAKLSEGDYSGWKLVGGGEIDSITNGELDEVCV